MKEENWYKFLVISTILHVFVMGALSIPIKKPVKKFDLSSAYTVGLVGDIGGGGGRGGARGSPKAMPLPEPKAEPEKPPILKTKKQVATTIKSKPVPMRAEKEALSLSKKKAAQKEMPTREELSRLEARIRDMKRRTEYFDVSKGRAGVGPERWGGGGGGTGGGGFPGSGDGGGRALDPASQRYLLEVWERIKNAWGLPGMSSSKRNLETIVTIRIRKDGKIVDVNVEKRSGNRVYDESILRVLRSVDLPPIPSSLNMDSMEIGFRFLPGDLS
ncbi:cell envelope integrity protein TolA [Syntrophorhabdus aromaticivorans]|uniref:cell envelope integrity protein TolA n=1 Tax=Syntrophorhabdus aromaticivorans TaxID=328301 RepID=UPI0004105144|nr:cell envelope integrity protein TolA [Syntrophorhabdus aromaticivorans]